MKSVQKSPAGVTATYRVAGIQCAWQKTWEDTMKRNLLLTHTALDKNARLIVFPECFNLPWFHTVDTAEFVKMAELVPGPSTEPFIQLSRQYPSTFVCPIYEQTAESRFFSSIIIQAGQVVGVYRKIHLSRSGNWDETCLAESGELLPVVNIGDLNIGILMGWDAFFPEAVTSLALRGMDFLIVPSAAAMASKFRWLSVLTSHSVCNNVFVIRVNRCGKEGELEFYGESFCIDPFGVLMDEPTFHRDSVMITDLDLSEIAAAQGEFPFLKERRPEIYGSYPGGMPGREE